MSGWIAYWNGRFVPEEQISLPLSDRGFLLGDAVYEVTRTYRHVPFRLDWHLDRLHESLAYLGLDPRLSRQELEDLTREVLSRNSYRLGPDDDVWLTHRVTRGLNGPPFGGSPPGPPTVIITCRAIPFSRFARLYDEGVELRIPRIRLPAAGGVDPRAKTHNRLALALGAIEVAPLGRHVLPLFADVMDHVTESFSSNVFIVTGGELVTPPDEVVLGGVTRRVVLELARRSNLKAVRRPVHIRELAMAEEVFVTATSYGLLPARQVEGRVFRTVPGPITQMLLGAFSRLVGVDIVKQARAHAGPSSPGDLHTAPM